MKNWCVILILLFLLSCGSTSQILEEKNAQLNPFKEAVSQTPPAKCTIPKTERQFSSDLYYEGPLYDSHVHMPVTSRTVSVIATTAGFADMPSLSDIPADYIACLFQSEGIEKAFAFSLAPNPTPSRAISTWSKIYKQHDIFIPFYMPTPFGSLNPNPKTVDKILEENQFFQGYGEVKFDFHEIGNDHPLDPEYIEIYTIASKYNIPIMLHPAFVHKEEMEIILSNYPTIPFLLHGFDNSVAWIPELMEKYPNLFFSLDAELSGIFGFNHQYDPTKEEYLTYIKQNYNQRISYHLDMWKEAIHQHPDRFMWGSDRWYGWHFDQDVGAIIEEIGRIFIGNLDPAVQEKFAYKNAHYIITKPTFPPTNIPPKPLEKPQLDPSKGMGDLCRENCYEFCMTNMGRCKEFCSSNQDNPTCKKI